MERVQQATAFLVQRPSSRGEVQLLDRTVTSDGQIINVIDTPELFDSSVESEFIGKEIARCIDLAKDGIHAVLVVLSVRTRFTKEEEAAILSLQTLFGSKIIDYMIVVFTGGDELEENEETIEGYLGGGDCPEPLKGQRLSHQNEVESLEGKSNMEISKLNENMERSYDDQLKRITDMVELKLTQTTTRLEQQLAEEQAARLKAEENAQIAQEKSNDEIRRL